MTSSTGLGIDSLVLSTRARNTLVRGGLLTISSITEASDDHILSIRACGFGQLEEIRDAVARFHEYGPAVPRPLAVTDPALADIDVRAIGLRPRTARILLEADLKTISSVDKTPRGVLMALPGFGVTSFNDWMRCRAEIARTVAAGAFVPATVSDLGDLTSARRQRVRLAETELTPPCLAALIDLGLDTCADLTSFDRETLLNLLTPEVLEEVEAMMRLHNMTFRATAVKDIFAEPFAHLVRFAATEGHAIVPRDHVTDSGYRLGQWVAWVRQSAKSGDIDAARTRALSQVPGWAWSTRAAAQKKARAEHQRTLNALRAFVSDHGHPFPSPVEENEKHLAAALRALRADRNRVAPEVAAELDSITGWTWDASVARQRLDEMGQTRQRRTAETAFNEGLAHLKTYAAIHSHASPRHYFVTDDGFALGTWVIRTRRRRNALPPAQVEALESLQGWYWDGTEFYAEQRWRASLDRAASFIDFHGRDAYARTATDGDFRVGAWLHAQSISRTSLSAERQAMLEGLPWWQWNVPFKQDPSPGRRARSQRAWEQNMEALRGFLSTHGRLPTTTETYLGRNIGQWCVARRFEYRHGNMATERITDLESVDGWKWVVPMGMAAHVTRIEEHETVEAAS